MSFAAMATWQGLLIIAAVMAAAIWLFLLKMRPPQIRVPSLALWTRVIDEARELSFWERYRKAISLVVAALITLAILLAALRPQLSTSATLARTGRTSIVIDSSWSMLAETSSGQTRWDRAIARARALALAAGGEDVVLSTTADGVIEGPTPDVALIEAALDRIAPSGGEASAWPRVENAQSTYFLTDGAMPRPLDPDVIVESMFEVADNVAITAFDVRPSAALDTAGQAYLEVANYSSAAQSVQITLTRGNASLLDLSMDLAAGAAVQRVVPLERRGDARLRARISARANALVVDDEAVAWIAGAQPLSVTVVSDQAASFGPLLSQDPSLKTTFVSPANYKPGAESVVVFDRVLPAAEPTVPALYIVPPAATWIGVPGTSETAPLWTAGAWHPMLYGVDVQTMSLERARAYAGKGLDAIAFSATRTPLIYVHDAPDQRFAIFTFGVTESKLMFAPGFPPLMSNAIDWLAHPVASATRRPGPATFNARLATITGPDGKAIPVSDVSGVSIASLARPGFYDLKSAGASSVIAVNAGDPDTSDLRRTRLPASVQTTASSPLRSRPWWLLAAAAALFLLAAEWWTWQRRVTV